MVSDESPRVETVWDWLDARARPGNPGDLAGRSGHHPRCRMAGRHAGSDRHARPIPAAPPPAIINLDIETALRGHGIENLASKTPDCRPPGPPTGCPTRAAPSWKTTASPRRNPQAARNAARTASRSQCDTDQPVRLDPLQGAMALHGLPGTLRLFQMHLRHVK